MMHCNAKKCAKENKETAKFERTAVKRARKGSSNNKKPFFSTKEAQEMHVSIETKDRRTKLLLLLDGNLCTQALFR